MDDGPRRVSITIQGLVQGVGFRYFVVQEARRLKLAGWVANQGDGSVKVVAQGREEKLRELIRRLRSGPPLARVRRMDVNWEKELDGRLIEFEVRFQRWN